MELNKVYQGNNIDVLKTFEDNSIDSIVTDPPYGISFMNKHWDYDVPNARFWKECLRVLKPGGHMLVACGTRTQHRMAVNIEDGGFEIRDIIAWIYGSGFPKSHDISKAIDKKLGAERKVIGINQNAIGRKDNKGKFEPKVDSKIAEKERKSDITAPSTQEAKQYEGWGTALKPAMELWTLARKPIKGTVAENVLKYGTGGINIDECRVATDDDISGVSSKTSIWGDGKSKQVESNGNEQGGRFPANVIHDGSEEVVKLFPSEAGGGLRTPNNNKMTNYTNTYTPKEAQYSELNTYGDTGSAARFFYTAKASQKERNWGLKNFEKKYTASAEFRPNHMEKALKGENGNPYGRWQPKKNIHPTVKPLGLMRYLVRLITPKGGVCLDPFLGSGTTAVACKAEKFNYIGIELMPEYVEIAEARIKAETVQYDIFDFLDE
jgi:site-specific DNA-methyltransferase (adenine-specific)